MAGLEVKESSGKLYGRPAGGYPISHPVVGGTPPLTSSFADDAPKPATTAAANRVKHRDKARGRGSKPRATGDPALAGKSRTIL